MKIALTGGTGFIGRHLTAYFSASGHQIILIRRPDLEKGVNHISKIINSADVLINLAGSPVIKRWTSANKSEILASRLNTTNLLVSAIFSLANEEQPKVFISASAIGIYGPVGMHTEESTDFDSNFLSVVCQQWESCLEPLSTLDIRTCVIRIGLVLAHDGGMLGKLIPMFKAGLGGKIGSGKQGFSFIHILDLCHAIDFLVMNDKCSGVFNMTAPGVSTNKEFTEVFAKAVNRPALFAVPEVALKLVYGEAAVTLLKGQSVYPRHLIDSGFEFSFGTINLAIRAVLSERSVVKH